MKYLIALSSLLLCAVTLSSTVLFWSSMPTDLFGKILAGVTASALECCKYSFFPAGIYFLRKGNYSGALLLIIGLVLLLVSVAATTGFLQNAYNQQNVANQHSSIEYQTKIQQLNSLQQQIDTLNGLIAADAQADYRTRALEYSKQVKNLEEKRNTALADIQNIKEAPQGNAQSLFSSLSIPLHSSPEAVRQGAFMSLALIVDICAIACLLALTGLKAKVPIKTESKPLALAKPSDPPVSTPKQKKPQEAPTALTESEEKLAARILAGEWGQQPSVRAIIADTKTPHKSVKKIIVSLMEKNEIKQEGQKYYLTQTVIEG